MSKFGPFLGPLIERRLRAYPALLEYFFRQPFTDGTSRVSVETNNDPRLPFFPDLTKTWMSGMVYENHRLGTRHSRLFLFGGGGETLFSEDSCTPAIGRFIRIFESAIRTRTFRAAAFVSRTVWHSDYGERLDDSREELAKRTVGDKLRTVVHELPDHVRIVKPPEEILDEVPLNAVLLPSFSAAFRKSFEEAVKPLVLDVGNHLQERESRLGAKIEKELGFDRIRIQPVPIHKDVELFSISDGATCGTVMLHDGTPSLQSFTGSKTGLSCLLSNAFQALEREHSRPSAIL